MMMRRVPTNQTTLQVVLFVLLCIVTKLSSGFNVAPSTTTALTSITRWQQQQNALPQKSHTHNCSLRLQAHPSSCNNINYSHQRRGSNNNNSGGRALFPQREQNHHHRSSKRITLSLQMSDDTNDSNDTGVSENQNLLVRIWSKLRTLMAKLWVSQT